MGQDGDDGTADNEPGEKGEFGVLKCFRHLFLCIGVVCHAEVFLVLSGKFLEPCVYLPDGRDGFFVFLLSIDHMDW